MRPMTFRGIACPFNSEAVVDGVVETVEPHAFVFDGRDVTVQHGCHDGRVVARRGLGARFFQDRHGLKFEVELPDTGAGLAAFQAVASGQIEKCSVNFSRMEFADEIQAG